MAKKETEKKSKGLIPRRPFTELTRWEREMERMFDDFFRDRFTPFWEHRWWPARAGRISFPVIDLYEEKEEVVAKVELPGIEKNEIHVNITDHLLQIRGEKKKEEEIKEEDYYRSERSYGSFSRTVELPREVQSDKARASFKDGVLEIRIPKTEEARKKEIKIEIS